MGKPTARLLKHAIAASAAWSFSAGPAQANPRTGAAPPAVDAPAKSDPRPRAAAPVPPAPPARDRLAAFFERTKGATRVISASEVWERVDSGATKYLVVDVRPSEDYAGGHIPGAISMPLEVLFREANLARLSAGGKTIVLVCHSGHLESMALGGLVALGFEPYVLRFGMLSWAAESRIKAGSPEQKADAVHGLGAPVEK